MHTQPGPVSLRSMAIGTLIDMGPPFSQRLESIRSQQLPEKKCHISITLPSLVDDMPQTTSLRPSKCILMGDATKPVRQYCHKRLSYLSAL